MMLDGTEVAVLHARVHRTVVNLFLYLWKPLQCPQSSTPKASGKGDPDSVCPSPRCTGLFADNLKVFHVWDVIDGLGSGFY